MSKISMPRSPAALVSQPRLKGLISKEGDIRSAGATHMQNAMAQAGHAGTVVKDSAAHGFGFEAAAKTKALITAGPNKFTPSPKVPQIVHILAGLRAMNGYAPADTKGTTDDQQKQNQNNRRKVPNKVIEVVAEKGLDIREEGHLATAQNGGLDIKTDHVIK